MDFAADSKVAELLLRHREVHVDRIERLKRHDRIAGLQVLAQVHLTEPENPRERRPDRLAPDRGLCLPRLRDRLLVLGCCLVVLRLRRDALLAQAFHSREVDRRQAALCLGGGELCHLVVLAGIELDSRNESGQVRGDRHAVNRRDGPDGVHGRWPARLARADRGDGLRRRPESGVLRDSRLDLADLHDCDGRDEDGHSDESQDHPFFHVTSPCLHGIDIAKRRASGFTAPKGRRDSDNSLHSRRLHTHGPLRVEEVGRRWTVDKSPCRRNLRSFGGDLRASRPGIERSCPESRSSSGVDEAAGSAMEQWSLAGGRQGLREPAGRPEVFRLAAEAGGSAASIRMSAFSLRNSATLVGG